MWFKDPQRAQQTLKMYEDREENGREQFIRDFLFFGCTTGKNLDKTFGKILGEDDNATWRWLIIWEETSPKIGNKASSKYPPDTTHMQNVINKHNPHTILLFGKTAQQGYNQLPTPKNNPTIHLLPHPAARHPTTLAQLTKTAHILKQTLNNE
jgi:hypothetical protein